MKIFSKPEQLKQLTKPVVMAVGFFDGVHLGHREVLASTLRRSLDIKGEAWVMTFAQHPLSVLAPYKRPRLLSTTEERLKIFAALGMHGVLLVDFTTEIAEFSPLDFVRWLCDAECASEAHAPIREIRCGDNWRFGLKACGTPATLAELGRDYGFDVVVVPYAGYKDVEISSTRIRYAIREGRLQEANGMLGRAYSIHGKVVSGRGLANRLQMATANIIPDVDLLPPNGVYAVRTKINGRIYGGVANLGVRPTFPDTSPSEIVLETHIFDFNGELYNQEIVVYFIAFIRAERKFDSPEMLVQQVGDDMTAAARILSADDFQDVFTH